MTSKQKIVVPQEYYSKPVLTEHEKKTRRKVYAQKVGGRAGRIFRTLILIGLCFVILLPIFQKFSYAFRSPNDLTNPQVVWIPSEFSTANVGLAMDLLDYWPTLVRTTLLSLVVMFIQVMASAIAGYAFAKLRFKGSNILFYLILFTLVVPNETLHVSRSLFLVNTTFFGIKLMGTVLSILILSAFGQGIRSAIFIYLFRQFFRNIPAELEESAQVDGAGVIRTFWSVMLPNARGAIVVVALFAFVWQWNDYYFARLFSIVQSYPVLAARLGEGTDRLFTVISGWVAKGKPIFDTLTDEALATDPMFYGLIANTAALLMMLPLLIGYFIVKKQFVEGIERTGITG